MAKKAIVAGTLTLALLACNSQPSQTSPQAAPEAARDYGNELAALSEGQRNAVFIRAIRDSGRDCQNVQQSEPHSPVNGAAAWTATCERGTKWIIITFGEGNAQVLSPAELEAGTREGSSPNATE